MSKALQGQVSGSYYKDLAIQPVQIYAILDEKPYLSYGLKYMRVKESPEQDMKKLRHYLQLDIELVGEPLIKKVRLSEDKKQKLAAYLNQFSHINKVNAFAMFVAWKERRLSDAVAAFDKGILLCQNTNNAD